MSKNMPHRQRFAEKVRITDGCHHWVGAKDSAGYGRFRLHGVVEGAHRVALHWSTGLPVRNPKSADHTCHNRLCVNPEHLRWVTPTQNNQNVLGARSTSSTGIRGVYLTPTGKYFGRVTLGGKIAQCPVSSDLDKVSRWVKDTRLELFTHNDHDRVLIS